MRTDDAPKTDDAAVTVRSTVVIEGREGGEIVSGADAEGVGVDEVSGVATGCCPNVLNTTSLKVFTAVESGSILNGLGINSDRGLSSCVLTSAISVRIT